MKADVERVARRIRGLSARQRQPIIDGAKALIDAILHLPERQCLRVAERLANIRRSLSGPGDQPPQITGGDGDT